MHEAHHLMGVVLQHADVNILGSFINDFQLASVYANVVNALKEKNEALYSALAVLHTILSSETKIDYAPQMAPATVF